MKRKQVLHCHCEIWKHAYFCDEIVPIVCCEFIKMLTTWVSGSQGREWICAASTTPTTTEVQIAEGEKNGDRMKVEKEATTRKRNFPKKLGAREKEHHYCVSSVLCESASKNHESSVLQIVLLGTEWSQPNGPTEQLSYLIPVCVKKLFTNATTI